jgi:hypothetical protein
MSQGRTPLPPPDASLSWTSFRFAPTSRARTTSTLLRYGRPESANAEGRGSYDTPRNKSGDALEIPPHPH